MVALDFPDAPTVGQVFDKWTWNGTVWALTAGGALVIAGSGLATGAYPTGFTKATLAGIFTSDATVISAGTNELVIQRAGVFYISASQSFQTTGATSSGAFIQAYVKVDQPSVSNVIEMLGGLNASFGSIAGMTLATLTVGTKIWVEHVVSGTTANLRQGVLIVQKAA